MIWSQCEGMQSQQHLLASTTAYISISQFPFPLRLVGVAGPLPSVSNVILFGLNVCLF